MLLLFYEAQNVGSFLQVPLAPPVISASLVAAAQALQSASASIFDKLLLGHYLLRKRTVHDDDTTIITAFFVALVDK